MPSSTSLEPGTQQNWNKPRREVMSLVGSIERIPDVKTMERKKSPAWHASLIVYLMGQAKMGPRGGLWPHQNTKRKEERKRKKEKAMVGKTKENTEDATRAPLASSLLQLSVLSPRDINNMRDCSSSYFNTFHCRAWQMVTWLLGRHTTSSMQLYAATSLLELLCVASMVTKGE
ncbi:uncharacterized protein LOC123411835 isoform X2 [Hordeum vulgare subsp. vulgare]|uniref:uncharacterized protein LOC123411835 isoform X2 n=1 Tax=Hordeum vulgare subsp. vulgare TaxID=112509 RepID=UPI00162AFF2A|nr:uncharacterized protein LOC123411835 isoform X2 [Hordeum vulgare subsp. vulgare]